MENWFPLYCRWIDRMNSVETVENWIPDNLWKASFFSNFRWIQSKLNCDSRSSRCFWMNSGMHSCSPYRNSIQLWTDDPRKLKGRILNSLFPYLTTYHHISFSLADKPNFESNICFYSKWQFVKVILLVWPWRIGGLTSIDFLMDK